MQTETTSGISVKKVTGNLVLLKICHDISAFLPELISIIMNYDLACCAKDGSRHEPIQTPDASAQQANFSIISIELVAHFLHPIPLLGNI